jgi:hypothetical protein
LGEKGGDKSLSLGRWGRPGSMMMTGETEEIRAFKLQGPTFLLTVSCAYSVPPSRIKMRSSMFHSHELGSLKLVDLLGAYQINNTLSELRRYLIIVHDASRSDLSESGSMRAHAKLPTDSDLATSGNKIGRR